MVAFKFTALALGASLLAEAVIASPAGSHLGAIRRDRRLALRQSTTESYEGEEPIVCDASLDTPQEDGSCDCGPGRQQATKQTCELSPAAKSSLEDYAVFSVSAPVPLAIAITTSYAISAPAAVLTARQCGAICETEAACIGFYLQPGSTLNQCWKIGGSGAYSDPRLTGIPFTAKNSSKRDEGVVGSIGAPGGVLGIAAEPTDGSANSSTCLSGVDNRMSDFKCECGAGRVHDSPEETGCKTAPSARARRARRDSFEGVQW